MRLVTSEEMRLIDQHAIQKIGILSLVLMENAGVKVLFTLEKILDGIRGKRFTIVCGKGNNGGDGLVIARHLINSGIPVNVFLVAKLDELSSEAKANYQVLSNMGYDFPVLENLDGINRLRIAMEFSDCVIDAVFGTGIKGNITGFSSNIINAMNDTRAKKISIDLPSGLCGTTGKASMPTFNADITIALGAPKVGLFLFPGRDYVGEIWTADIGIPSESFNTYPSTHTLITKEIVQRSLPNRNERMNKGNAGHLLLLAGSKEYKGAGVLSAFGALRSGVGIVTLGAPEDIVNTLGRDLPPELIVRGFSSMAGVFKLSENDILSLAGKYRAIVAGPGWGRGDAQYKSLQSILSIWKAPLILDADALNCIDSKISLSDSKATIIITPHIGEMSRLTGLSIDKIKNNPIEVALNYATENKCVVVLKSAITIIASPESEVFICSRPNSGLAKGGSGDLLAGLMGGLLAMGCEPINAAIVAVYLHSEAGELAKKELGEDAMTISEVISYLPKAFVSVRQPK